VDPTAVDEAWLYLSHRDRFIRWAARTAIEHQPAETWAAKALTEKDAGKQLEALLGLVRVTGIDPQHRKPSDPPVDKGIQAMVLAALAKLDWDRLTHEQRITLVRTYQICLVRFGRPDDAAVARILAQLDPRFPAPTRELNWLLCETLVFLQSPTVAAKAVALIEAAPTQEEQMEYARSLRMLKAGWTTQTRTAYFAWFLKAANYRGGASFEKFLEFIRNDALATLTEQEKLALRDVLAATPAPKKSPIEAMANAFAGREVKEWTLDELAAGTEAGLRGRSFENGRKMFAAAACFTCHRFANEGGMTGPDLTSAGGRYSPRDLIDQILAPSKEINEQFVPVIIRRNKGTPITGVIVNLKGDSVIVNADPADPNDLVNVDRKDVKSMELSKVSPMPEGLLQFMTKEEVLDLAAYTLSGGDPKHEAFKR
jgi:putative heme-binding domain-containing protein